MRKTLVLLGFATILLANKCEQVRVNVELNITQTKSYCGGAAPSDEILSALRTPHKLGQTVYILDYSNTCVDSFASSNSEKKQYSLPVGKYSLRFTPEASNITLTANSSTSDCVQEWKSRVLTSFEVVSDTSLDLNVHVSCNPCYPPPP